MAVPTAAVEHYKTMQELQAQAVATADLQWSSLTQSRIVDSWIDQTKTLTPIIADLQYRAALDGATYSAMTLAQQGVYVAPTEFVNAAAIAGYASDGRALDTLLQTAAWGALAYIGEGMATQTALDTAAKALAQLVQTIIADAGRQAGGIDIVARPTTGYVRMLNPPSCARCVVLAGKFFRFNAGFLRHPGCDCVHVTSTVKSREAALREGLIEDQYEYFKSLSGAEQDETFTKAGAQAIRDGADINQVVNSRRGMTANGNFTTEGTTPRGLASKNLALGQRRMTPELIYNMSRSREETLQLLRRHGYLMPRGQVPNVDNRQEGFGQMGAGGARKAASTAVLEARRTGIRDPNSRYTMTAAERRLYDARTAYETALSGVSPYTSPGFGNTPDPYGIGLNRVGATTRPVTVRELATAELHYRRMLATGGQKFTK